MTKITEIPLSDLLEDREASLKDIRDCEAALFVNVTRYGGANHDENSVQDRIDANKEIVKVIEAELKRRNVQIVITGQANR